jgi:hypothetical protein
MKMWPQPAGGYGFGADFDRCQSFPYALLMQQLGSSFTAESLFRSGAGPPRLRQNDVARGQFLKVCM